MEIAVEKKYNLNIYKKVIAFYYKYKYLQWSKPKKIKYKCFGITTWKWCGIFIPCFWIFFDNENYIGYDTFHNGNGIVIFFPKIVIINLCLFGKIAYHYKKGILRIRINNKEFRY